MVAKAKKLTQADVLKKTEAWGSLQKKIAKAESERETELAPVLEKHEKQLAPINAKHDAVVDPLQEKADALETEIIDWLDAQKKTTRIESRSAVAEFLKSTKIGNRVVLAEKFVARCMDRKIKGFWNLVSVTIKNAETVMGKDDMEEICTKPKVESKSSSLTLKD